MIKVCSILVDRFREFIIGGMIDTMQSDRIGAWISILALGCLSALLSLECLL